MPAGGALVGREIDDLDPILIENGPFQELPISILQSFVVPVIVLRPSTISLIGTAFNIAPGGLFVTAKHVVDEALAICNQDPGSWIAVLWMTSGSDHEDVEDLLGGQIPVKLIQVSESHDVALLQTAQLFKDEEPVNFPVCRLDTRVPEIGTPVLGVGYTKMDVVRHHNTPELRDVSVEQSCHSAHGVVTEVFPAGRDSVMIPFPAFSSSARFDPGMSGGPVFSGDSAKVCGVVCSSVGMGESTDEYISYAAMALNVLTLDVTTDQAKGESATLYELVRRGIVIADDNFKSIELSDGGDGKKHLTFPGPGAGDSDSGSDRVGDP